MSRLEEEETEERRKRRRVRGKKVTGSRRKRRFVEKLFLPTTWPQTFGPIITLISSTGETYCSVDASYSCSNGCSPFILCYTL